MNFDKIIIKSLLEELDTASKVLQLAAIKYPQLLKN